MPDFSEPTVSNLAILDHAQDFRPDRCVIAFVTFFTAGLKPNHQCKALHRIHSESRFFLPLSRPIQVLKLSLTRHY